MVPEISSRHSAMRAIMARAESLIALGAMPSAQLTVESALALEDAVRDHFQNGIGSPRMKKARAGLAQAWQTRCPCAFRQQQGVGAGYGSADCVVGVSSDSAVGLGPRWRQDAAAAITSRRDRGCRPQARSRRRIGGARNEAQDRPGTLTLRDRFAENLPDPIQTRITLTHTPTQTQNCLPDR